MNQQDPEDIVFDEDDIANENLTAKPTSGLDKEGIASSSFDYGDMNIEDAKESGYTDEKGEAVSKAKSDDVAGLPTGAYTDVGAGRSSVVRREDEKKSG